MAVFQTDCLWNIMHTMSQALVSCVTCHITSTAVTDRHNPMLYDLTTEHQPVYNPHTSDCKAQGQQTRVKYRKEDKEPICEKENNIWSTGKYPHKVISGCRTLKYRNKHPKSWTLPNNSKQDEKKVWSIIKNKCLQM